MPQHLNLLDASFQRPRELLGSATGLAALAVTLGASVVLTVGLHVKSAQALLAAQGAEVALQTLQQRAGVSPHPAPSQLLGELVRLRAVEAGQLRITAALDSGQAGVAQGYAQYLLALSRQALAQLWLTGFSVGADGHELELNGRMTDPGQLPDYLRRLNAEPLFKGREFAQLSLKTVGAEPTATAPSGSGAPGVTEFSLRASVSASGVH